MTRSKGAKPKPVRKRGVPVQVYVSQAEHAQLARFARDAECTISQIVRDWIRGERELRALRRTVLRHPAGAFVAPPPDPRQLEIE